MPSFSQYDNSSVSANNLQTSHTPTTTATAHSDIAKRPSSIGSNVHRKLLKERITQRLEQVFRSHAMHVSMTWTPCVVQCLLLGFTIWYGQWFFAAMLGATTLTNITYLLQRMLNERNAQHKSTTYHATAQDNVQSENFSLQHNSNYLMQNPYAPERHYPFEHTPYQSVDFQELRTCNTDYSALSWQVMVRQWVCQDVWSHAHSGYTYRTHCNTDNQTHTRARVTAIAQPYAITLDNQHPHALVAGTTGSGKSTLLASWCMALATHYSPQALQFVFLDFKGGATFQHLQHLPHCRGNVSDLSLPHATRALRALELELQRREQLLSREQVTHSDYLSTPLSKIIVVVDEFYALKTQLPDYINRLTKIASLGRSLGMYIILSTQNPVGQLSGQLQANIALRICLRVQDSLQSRELLHNDMATYIHPAHAGVACICDGVTLQYFLTAQCTQQELLVQECQLAQQFLDIPAENSLFSHPLPTQYSLAEAHRHIDSSTSNVTGSASYDIAKDNSVVFEPDTLSVKACLVDDGTHLLPCQFTSNDFPLAIISNHRDAVHTIIRTVQQVSQSLTSNAHILHLPDHAQSTGQDTQKSSVIAPLFSTTEPAIATEIDECNTVEEDCPFCHTNVAIACFDMSCDSDVDNCQQFFHQWEQHCEQHMATLSQLPHNATTAQSAPAISQPVPIVVLCNIDSVWETLHTIDIRKHIRTHSNDCRIIIHTTHGRHIRHGEHYQSAMIRITGNPLTDSLHGITTQDHREYEVQDFATLGRLIWKRHGNSYPVQWINAQ